MDGEKTLEIKRKARGVIPSRVSELENDLEYITKEDLKDIVLANQVGNYTGISDEDVKVVVDNLYKTIKVEILKTLQDDLKKLLPTEDGNIKDGGYMLKAFVSSQAASFRFVEETFAIPSVYYFGCSSVGKDSITDSIVTNLTSEKSTKITKEVSYLANKQYQVFAYPEHFGKLSKIIHLQSGLEVTNGFALKEMLISGYIYYVYISEIPSTGDYTYRFIY